MGYFFCPVMASFKWYLWALIIIALYLAGVFGRKVLIGRVFPTRYLNSLFSSISPSRVRIYIPFWRHFLMDKFSYLNNATPACIEDLYLQYQRDSSALSPDWQRFFEGYEFQQLDLSVNLHASLPHSMVSLVPTAPSQPTELDHHPVITHIRRQGHLVASTNPLSHSNSTQHTQFYDRLASLRAAAPQLEQSVVDRLLTVYTQSVGVEFPYEADFQLNEFIQLKMEDSNWLKVTPDEQRSLLSHLHRAVAFEQFLHTKFVGKKRFSLEGLESFIPGLHAMFDSGAQLGATEFVVGMAHRGRLNALVNVFQKPFETVFAEFDESVVDAFDRAGDVKYHMGQSTDLTLPNGKTIHLSLLFNPSHLEAVGAVVSGMCRAKADHRYAGNTNSIVPIIVHGDAALSGQGINYEITNMSQLPGFSVGGAVHIVLNNQVGFTTDCSEGRSSRYCTDIARLTNSPVFHVNTDQPEAVLATLRLAVELRQRFGIDVYVDIIGYRRYGHNEGDEPRFTQPSLYQWLQSHPNIYKIYHDRLMDLGVITTQFSTELSESFEVVLKGCLDLSKSNSIAASEQPFASDWRTIRQAKRHDFDESVQSLVAPDLLQSIGAVIASDLSDADILPKLKKIMDTRSQLIQSGQVDWATAELMAYGSLIYEGIPVRLTGQDAQRGTFSHRHAAVRDLKTNERLVPLNALATATSRFQVYNTLLSEYAALAYEYGYSLATPHGLTIWEAQFGDFANGAQVVIDQFISSSEVKWERYSGLVLLLPHAQEGQGPEHSSARLERFLQLAAQDNMLIVNITTPANFFHALRRQVLAPYRKPLVVMSPKSLFRHPNVVSSITDLSNGRFREVMDDTTVQKSEVTRVVLCSGKLYYDLLEKREKDGLTNVALVRLEQLYPLPKSQLTKLRKSYPVTSQWVWAQEEPANQGALAYIRGAFTGWDLQLLSRPESASPATGSMKRYEKIQSKLVKDALGV